MFKIDHNVPKIPIIRILIYFIQSINLTNVLYLFLVLIKIMVNQTITDAHPDFFVLFCFFMCMVINTGKLVYNI